MRVFLDANILFSASLPGSRTRRFLGTLFKSATCVTNTYAIEEARRNLGEYHPKRIPALMKLVTRCEISRGLAPLPRNVLPSKDTPILAGAIAAASTHLLTGDERHFGKLWGTTISGVKIVSPRMLAEEIL